MEAREVGVSTTSVMIPQDCFILAPGSVASVQGAINEVAVSKTRARSIRGSRITMSSSKLTIVGLCEDQSKVRITVRGGDHQKTLREVLPPLGLLLIDDTADGAELDIEVDLGINSVGAGQGLVQHLYIDGVEEHGGIVRARSVIGHHVASRLQTLIPVHAAVIEFGGHLVVLPGNSRSGKSSFCVAAHALGHTVVSDEYALVDPSNGLTSGWTRPVHVRGSGGTTGVDIARSISPREISLVAAVHYAESDPRMERISSGEVVTALLANTVCARLRPDDSFSAAVAVAKEATGIGGVRPDAPAAVEVMGWFLLEHILTRAEGSDTERTGPGSGSEI